MGHLGTDLANGNGNQAAYVTRIDQALLDELMRLGAFDPDPSSADRDLADDEAIVEDKIQARIEADRTLSDTRPSERAPEGLTCRLSDQFGARAQARNVNQRGKSARLSSVPSAVRWTISSSLTDRRKDENIDASNLRKIQASGIRLERRAGDGVLPRMVILHSAVLVGLFASSPSFAADSVGRQVRMALGIYARIITELSDVGYSEIRMLDWQTNRLIARDPHGSEVVLILNPNAAKVAAIEYIHLADR